MGGGCTRSQKTESPKPIKEAENRRFSKKLSLTNSRSPLITSYKLFQFKSPSNYLNSNLLIYTSYENTNNDFNVLDEKYSEIIRSNIYKTNGVAVGYSKGNKIDPNVQDKFFVLLDGNIEIFCVIDGHGPYGHIIAQSIQDKIFKVNFFLLFLSFSFATKR